MRFLLFELVTGEEPRFGRVGTQIPYVGQHRRAPASLPSGGRLVFTHDLPTSNTAPSVVYLSRDPRSVLLSEYRWQQRRRFAPGPFETFAREFVEGKTNPWGSWDGHVSRWLADDGASGRRRLVVRFEDLRADAVGELRRIADFLGLDASDDAIERAVSHNDLARMREKEDTGSILADSRTDLRFVGSGEVAGWRERLDPALADEIATAFAGNLARFGYEGANR